MTHSATIDPHLAYQIAETIRRDALARTQDRHTRYRIAGINQETILSLAPGPSTIPALEQIELPTGHSDPAIWEAANRAWCATMTPALVKKWAIALIHHISAEDRKAKNDRARHRSAAD